MHTMRNLQIAWAHGRQYETGAELTDRPHFVISYRPKRLCLRSFAGPAWRSAASFLSSDLPGDF